MLFGASFCSSISLHQFGISVTAAPIFLTWPHVELAIALQLYKHQEVGFTMSFHGEHLESALTASSTWSYRYMSLFQGGTTASLVPSEGSLISASLSHINTTYILLEIFTAFYIQHELSVCYIRVPAGDFQGKQVYSASFFIPLSMDFILFPPVNYVDNSLFSSTDNTWHGIAWALMEKHPLFPKLGKPIHGSC